MVWDNERAFWGCKDGANFTFNNALKTSNGGAMNHEVQMLIDNKNPNITWKIVQNNRDKPWDWWGLSRNPHTTWDIVKKHIDKPWDWFENSCNPTVTWDIVQQNPNILWNWQALSQNPNIGISCKEIPINHGIGAV